ncbi:MAG: hypothetical protein ABI382_14380 [Nakamurella sp.]
MVGFTVVDAVGFTCTVDEAGCTEIPGLRLTVVAGLSEGAPEPTEYDEDSVAGLASDEESVIRNAEVGAADAGAAAGERVHAADSSRAPIAQAASNSRFRDMHR